MKKRLLFVINNIEFLYSHRLALVLAAASRGYDVHVATWYDDHELKHTDKITYHPVKFNRHSMNPFRDVVVLCQLSALYRSLKPAIIHHVGMKPILYGSLVARLFSPASYINAISGIGYLFIHSSIKVKIARLFVLLGFKFGFSSQRAHFIFQNDSDRNEFQAHRLLYSSSNTVMIRGSGVDLEKFYKGDVDNAQPLIVFPARLLRDKGVAEFVSAVRLLKNSVKAHFVLVGDVDLLNPTSITSFELQEWCDEGLIACWGWRSDMECVFRQADIVCLPSYREGMPKALLEAAASACPIVTTDTPGCNDVVVEGENGFLVPVRDVKLLALRLQTLIESPQLRQKMGAQSRKRAEEFFGLDAVIDAHLKLYDSVHENAHSHAVLG